ncbi:MAG: OmpA family protein [Candidatus Kapaibacterium sp.]|nr:MAG: OmpA family protein [Candidatus Kapabacteria bacterium]
MKSFRLDGQECLSYRSQYVSVAQTLLSAHTSSIFLACFFILFAPALFAQDRTDTVTINTYSPNILIPNKRTADSTEKLRRELPGYQWLFGFYGFGSYEMHNANFAYLHDMQPICCPEATGNFISFGGGLGGVIDLRLSNRFQIQTRFNASLLSTTFLKGTHDTVGFGEDQARMRVVPILAEHKLGINAINVQFQPTLGIRLFEQLFLDIGVNVALPVAMDYVYSDSLRSELGNHRYRNGEATLAAQRGSVGVSLQNLSVYALGGLQWYIPLTRSTFLTPFVRYQHPLTDVVPTSIGGVVTGNGRDFAAIPLTNGSWRMASVQAGVAYQWGEGSINPIVRETVYERDTTTTIAQGIQTERVRRVSTEKGLVVGEQNGLVVERTVIHESYVREVPQTAAVKMVLTVTGIDVDGTRQVNPTVVVEEFESETYHPLLPHIFFADDAFDLRQTRQVQLLTPKAADAWTSDNISNDALSVHSQLLNIVGERMAKNPAARLLITGCTSNLGAERDDVELSMKRAKAVQTYLTTVWRIKADRIRLQARTLPEKPSSNDIADGIAENRRVELSATTPDILAPVVNRLITRSLTPPSLELRPVIDAPAGTRSWTMRLLRNGSALAQWTGTNEISEKETWRMEEKLLGESEIPLVATLTATDLEERSASVEERITVKQVTIKKKRAEQLDDNRLERFSLMLFDFDRAELNSENLGLLAFIKQRIQLNSTVTVLGYGDRVGSKEYNRDLAFRRCVEVKNFLQIPESNVKVIPIGNDFLLHDNSTPEGRSYCRIVQVVIATPLQK